MLEKKDLELLEVLKKLEKLQTDSDDKAEKVCPVNIPQCILQSLNSTCQLVIGITQSPAIKVGKKFIFMTVMAHE
jgi:hypothetical protein